MNLPTDVSVTPLTPLAFLGRSVAVFPGRCLPPGPLSTASEGLSYRELASEVTARGLRASGARPGDRIAYLCPNIPEQVWRVA